MLSSVPPLCPTASNCCLLRLSLLCPTLPPVLHLQRQPGARQDAQEAHQGMNFLFLYFLFNSCFNCTFALFRCFIVSQCRLRLTPHPLPSRHPHHSSCCRPSPRRRWRDSVSRRDSLPWSKTTYILSLTFSVQLMKEVGIGYNTRWVQAKSFIYFAPGTSSRVFRHTADKCTARSWTRKSLTPRQLHPSLSVFFLCFCSVFVAVSLPSLSRSPSFALSLSLSVLLRNS